MPRKSSAIPIVDPETKKNGIRGKETGTKSTVQPTKNDQSDKKNPKPSSTTTTPAPSSQYPPLLQPTHAQAVNLDEESSSAFNVYARPFVPTAFAVINTLPGRSISTIPKKAINYDAYISQSLGPAAGFLPTPRILAPPPIPSAAATASLGPRHYEAFFEYHQRQEREAEGREIEACSLYGHECNIKPAFPSLQPDEALLTVHVPGLRENSPFVEEDDVAAPGWTGVIYFARVMGVARSTETLHLRVTGLPPFSTSYTARFNIQFQVSMDRHMPMLYALPEAQNALPHGGWLNSMLFPTFVDVTIQEQLHPGVFEQQFFDPKLNLEQKKAVESIWSRCHGTLPYLVSGPPGTGKTKTIIETALQLIKNSTEHSHIILCAPSDPAADILCQRLIGPLEPGQMLRLNRPCRTFAEVPDALLPFCFVHKEEFSLPPFHILMRCRVVVTTCKDASMLTRGRMTNKDLYAIQIGMQDTCSVINPRQPVAPEPTLHWSALLIDEAAQATEPEALIPLVVVAPPAVRYSGTPAPLVVMAGDEHQLGPRTSLAHSPLQKSLFARLFSRPVYADHPLARGKKGEAPTPLTRSILPVLRPAFTNLIRNYRSHPAILALPSHLFYWDTLEPEATGTDRLSTWECWKGRRWPVLFHDNPSLDELELPGLFEGTGGWYNHGEAAIACAYAKSLVQSGLVEQEEVCIMSPFKAQVTHLRKCIRKPAYGSLWDVNIGPTEAFQGLERSVVILCVTRARKKFVERDQQIGWGIIGTPNKLNVALTRAKHGLIVVGKRELLVEDPNWKAFIDFCERNGLVSSVPQTSKDHNGAVDDALHPQGQKSMLIPAPINSGLLRSAVPSQEIWPGSMMQAPPGPEDQNDYDDDNNYDNLNEYEYYYDHDFDEV
ncbi:hypothetical protein M406DRAFT_97417 [Cryphonectria parasitica EP155]|uniref:RNA helicase n=1 Tax=Cryphonectria parasitica (strain ATCC 38755 / EP155) TaxID=660469 RepID=A0A9P4Y4F5_CRYP1|nr:uncharacterized protein M406DRAFT_97417 [Cryphonectria parasitica EP155]KAF3765975.1 hypothetical protein M406DRAFT_97417 [Cryphonectria parasitica EP155]